MMVLLLEIERARRSFQSAMSGAWEPIRSARRRTPARYGIPPGFVCRFNHEPKARTPIETIGRGARGAEISATVQ